MSSFDESARAYITVQKSPRSIGLFYPARFSRASVALARSAMSGPPAPAQGTSPSAPQQHPAPPPVVLNGTPPDLPTAFAELDVPGGNASLPPSHRHSTNLGFAREVERLHVGASFMRAAEANRRLLHELAHAPPRQRWAAALAHLRPRLSGASAPDSAVVFSFSLPPSRQPSGRASCPPSRQPSEEAARQPVAAETEAEVAREMCPVCYCELADFIPSLSHRAATPRAPIAQF